MLEGLGYKQHSLPCTTDSKMHTLCTPQKSNTCPLLLLHGKMWDQDKADSWKLFEMVFAQCCKSPPYWSKTAQLHDPTLALIDALGGFATKSLRQECIPTCFNCISRSHLFMQDYMPAICVSLACGFQKRYIWGMLLSMLADNFLLAPRSWGEVCVCMHMHGWGMVKKHCLQLNCTVELDTTHKLCKHLL